MSSPLAPRSLAFSSDPSDPPVGDPVSDPSDPSADDLDDDSGDQPLAPLPDLDGEGEEGADEPIELPPDASPATLDDEAAGDALDPVVLHVWTDEGETDDESAVDLGVDLGWLDTGSEGDAEPIGGFDEPLTELPDHHPGDDSDGPLAPDEPLPDDSPGSDDDDSPPAEPPRLHRPRSM